MTDRIGARKGRAVPVDIEDTYGTRAKDRAAVGLDVASMAADPGFEAAAMRFETRIGGLAYRHPKSNAVAKRAGGKVLAYVEAKWRDSMDRVRKMEQDLAAIGMDRATWSGAVGKQAKTVREVLTEGALGERVAHVESFTTNVLAKEILENRTQWDRYAKRAGLDTAELAKARERIVAGGDRDHYHAYDTPEDSAAARQWHTRARITEAVRAAGAPAAKHHPSSLKEPDLAQGPTVSTRTVSQIESPAPAGLGVELGAKEKALQEDATGGRTRLAWEEGARVWALNELDAWVHAQRQLSVPLAAGPSGTTARIMQAFAFLGVGPADDVRLAAIGALLPPRHHTLVEVMAGAKPYSATPYREGAHMYRDLSPLTEAEVRGEAELYPDEFVDPHGARGGRSR